MKLARNVVVYQVTMMMIANMGAKMMIDKTLFDIGYLLDHTFPEYIMVKERILILRLWIELAKLKVELMFWDDEE